MILALPEVPIFFIYMELIRRIFGYFKSNWSEDKNTLGTNSEILLLKADSGPVQVTQQKV